LGAAALRAKNGGFLRFRPFGTLLVKLSASSFEPQFQGSHTMFNADFDIARIATAAIAALMISTACIAAAVGPGAQPFAADAAFAALAAPASDQAAA
jgi:hypothetical protein